MIIIFLKKWVKLKKMYYVEVAESAGNGVRAYILNSVISALSA